MQYLHSFQKVSILLAVLTIASIPFFFVKLFSINGLQINLFHLLSGLFILFSVTGFHKRLISKPNIFEIFIALHLGVILIFIIGDNQSSNASSFIIKAAYYALYFKMLVTVFSSLERPQVYRLVRVASKIGIVFFLVNFFTGIGIAGYDWPLSPELHCDKPVNPYDYPVWTAESGLPYYPPPAQNRYVYELTVPALAAFDEFWPARKICYSKEIGINALAGIFLLYFNILMFLPGKKKLIDYVLIALSFGFIYLTDSKATLILLAVTLLWGLFTRLNKRISINQKQLNGILSILIGGLLIAVLLIPPEFFEKLSNSSRLQQYTTTSAQITEHLFTGKGLGATIEKAGYRFYYPHNFILASGMMMGIWGIVSSSSIFLSLIFLWVQSAYRTTFKIILDDAGQLSGIFLIAPLTTLMIRSSVESIFMLSDWISLAVFFAITRRSTTHKNVETD